MPIAHSATDREAVDVDDTQLETNNEQQDTVTDDAEAGITDEPSDVGSTEAADTLEPSDQTDTASDDDAWRAPYRELGFENIETPEQAQERLLQAYRNERQQRAEAQRQAQYYQSVQAQLATRETVPTAQSPASDTPSGVIDSFSSNWIDINEKLLSEYVTRDEDGHAVFRPDAPEELRQQVLKFRQQKEQWGEVLSDPRQFAKAVDERLEAMLADRVTGVISERETKHADQTAEEQFFSENDWIFERDPLTGQSTNRPTRDGRRFGQALRHAAEMGIARRSDQLRTAMALFQAEQQQVAQAPAVARHTAQQVANQQRQQMLGRTNTAPSRQSTAAGVSDGPAGLPTGSAQVSRAQRIVTELQDEGYKLD